MSSEHSYSIGHAFQDYNNHFQASSHVVQAQKHYITKPVQWGYVSYYRFECTTWEEQVWYHIYPTARVSTMLFQANWLEQAAQITHF